LGESIRRKTGFSAYQHSNLLTSHPALEGDFFVNAGIWEDVYRTLQKPHLDPVLTGFNANMDRVIPVTAAVLGSLEHTVPASGLLLDRLKESMRSCSADEVFISNPSRYRELSERFSRSGTLTLGGQAGIAAVHLRSLGVPSVTCAVPAAGPGTCALLHHAGANPLTFEPGESDRSDIIHLVFEYPPGLVPVAENVVMRSNRFIVSPVHDPSTVIVPRASENSFLEQIASCRRAFLSGYQYLRTEQEFLTAARQIRMIRGVHPLMRTHVECVSGTDRHVLAMMLRHILPDTDSIGLNERELGLFMRALQAPDPASAGDGLPSSPVACVRDAVALAEATGVSRIHLHTYGYYVLILKSEPVLPEVSRNALLFAARVTADRAGVGEQVLSREGLFAYAAVREAFGPEKMPGIFMVDERVVVLIPTYISLNSRKTTGLGDVLSSTAFVADRF
jgi:ADP-dependent phosphofructokinase/glucokinase